MSAFVNRPSYAPGLVGFSVSLGMYGVALSQYHYYGRSFPHDKRPLKYLVLIIFTLDVLHTYAFTASEWWFLVKCRRSQPSACMQPLWQKNMIVLCAFFITFIAQGFYGHRVWIISNRNVLVTLAIGLMAIARLVLGLITISPIARDPRAPPNLLYLIIVQAISVACDGLISGSVFFYLRPSRAGVKRTETRIQNITDVFVNMGFLQCTTSIIIIILYFSNAGVYISLPGPITSKCYVNSVLAVLNARKPIGPIPRLPTFELPTIPLTSGNVDNVDVAGSSNSENHILP